MKKEKVFLYPIYPDLIGTEFKSDADRGAKSLGPKSVK